MTEQEGPKLSERRATTPSTKPRAKPHAHWINPAVPVVEPKEDAAPKIGKARMRSRRRREDRMVPRVDWTWVIIAVAFVGVVGVVGLVMLTATNSNNTAPAAALADTNDLPPDSSAPPPTSELVPAVLPTVVIKPWDGKQRVTILVMGLDKRPFEKGTGFRTDTLILVSLDPATNRVGMLSIPRDLSVPIPNVAEMQPINTAYVLGELNRPGFGPRLAADTVQYNLGMRVDHYVVVQFEAVINLVDAIGGVDIDVPKAIDDEEFPDMNSYGYDPLYIPAGRVHMDGMLALKYARTRHQDTDFDRTSRQQAVVMAIRQKALRVDMLPQLVAQSGVIWEQISRGVITDIAFEDLLSLGWYAKDIPDGSIIRGAIAGEYLQAADFNGKRIVTINRDTISKLLTDVFGANYNQ